MSTYVVIVDGKVENSFNVEWEAKKDAEERVKNGAWSAIVAEVLITAERSVKFTDTRPQRL
jgi:hypothetical protein